MLLRFPALALLVFLSTAQTLQGCSDDSSIKGTFVPTPQGDTDATGDLIPIQPGLTRSYSFSGEYKPDFASISNESQRSGYVCLRVDSTHDTATPAYSDASETTIQTTVKINGGPGIADIVVSNEGRCTELFGDQASCEANGCVYDTGTQYCSPSPNADATAVDATLTNLWLTHLLVPSRGHGFSSPNSVDCSTRQPPTPPFESPLTKLFYFDTRTTSDMSWGGWDGYNDACTNYAQQDACEAKLCAWSGGVCQNKTLNFVNKLLISMMTNMGCVNFSSSDPKCRKSTKTPPSNCGTYLDQTPCIANNCSWAFANNTGSCISMYSVELMWRETLTDGPAELRAQGGKVFHHFLMDYDDKGVVRHIAEDVGLDTNPAGPMKELDDSLCFAGAPCAQSQLNLDDASWSDAYCTF